MFAADSPARANGAPPGSHPGEPAAAPEHLVQFYETEAFLIDSLAAYVIGGLADGEACVVVATAEHRHALEARLRASGIDVAAAASRGQYVARDAAETLSGLLVEGSPDPFRFACLAGDLVRQAGRGRRVRVFGEMVALLWSRGDRTAALRLEDLWNDLQRVLSFTLYCAYPLDACRGAEQLGDLLHVCRAHSGVDLGESASSGEASCYLRNVAELQQEATVAEQALQEREAAVRALAESEERFRQIVETSRELIWETDAQGRHTYCNQAVERILGYRPEELVGRRAVQLLHEEDRRAAEAELAAHVREARGWDGWVLRWRHRDGSYRYLESNAVPILRGGSIVGFRGSDRDITEQVRARQELQRFFEMSVDMLCIADLEGRFVRLNPAWERVLGYTPAELMSRPYLEFVHPEDRAETVARMEGLARGVAIPAFENRYRCRDGSYRWLLWTSTPVPETGLVYAVAHDVTERKRAEQERARLLAALQSEHERLAVAFEHAPAFLTTLRGPEHVFEVANPAYYQLVGNRQLIGRTVREAFPELEGQGFFELLDEVYRTGRPFVGAEMPVDLDTEDGRRERRYVDFVYTPLRDPDGTVAGLLCHGVDVTERRRAQEALRESEARFRTTFEAAGIGIALVDVATGMMECNPALQRLLGYSRSELRHMRFEQFTHPEDLARELPLCEEVYAGLRDDYRLEKRYLRKDGQVVWADLVISVVRDGAGQLRYVIGMAEDITARRQAETRLRESEHRLREMLDGMPMLLAVLSPDGHLLDANSAALKAAGVTREQVLGRSFAELPWWDVSPAVRSQLCAAMERAARGEPSRFDTRNRFADQGLRDIDFSLIPLTDPDGRVTHLLPTGIDITDRVSAERALRESHELLRAVVDGAQDAIFVKDRAGRYLLVNEPCARLMGRPAAEIRGRTDAELLPAGVAAKFMADDRRVLEGGMPAVLEDHLVSEAGERICLTTKSPLRDESGRVTGLCGISRDLTDLRSMEEQLRQAQKMEAVGRLAGGVAHDFNNMLAVINGYASLLLPRAQDPYLTAGLTEIAKAGDRAATLTRQLLAFSRKQILMPRVLHLPAVVADLETMLHRLIGEEIRLEVEADPEVGQVRADPGQVEQCLLNLVVNARDAMPRGGTITIGVRRARLEDRPGVPQLDLCPGEYVELSVRDTGHGMHAEVAEHVFEPFYTTKGELGTGLGLATVYGIMKQSGGDVTVETQPERGAIFRLYFPRVEPTRPSEAPPPAAGGCLEGHETVLLVEDEEMVRRMVRTTLQLQGYQVLEAADGESALRLAHGYDEPIHLLLTDVVMPGQRSGRDVADGIHRCHPETRALFMSGYTEDAVLRHRVRQEESAFLQKPFGPVALAQKVREVLSGA